MKAVRDKLKALLTNNSLNCSGGLYEFYVIDRDDEVGYEQAVEDMRLQWINSVAAILDIAHKDELLQIWRKVTSTRGNEEEYQIVLTQIIEDLYNNSLPKPHKDMPVNVREDYEEAQDVFPYSARSAAALLRLALQKLCKELGEKGKNINNDIGSLVKKGLPDHIQQALDIVRVVGNEAVHPGVINIRDNPEIAMELFTLINEIIEDQITMKQRIKTRYDSLPKTKLEEIEKRDAKK